MQIKNKVIIKWLTRNSDPVDLADNRLKVDSMIESGKTWAIVAFMVVLSAAMGAGGTYYQMSQERTVKDVIGEYKYLESKGCAGRVKLRFTDIGTARQDVGAYCDISSISQYAEPTQ